MKKRYSFLLLEILIAIALIGICGTLLLRPSHKVAQKKVAHLKLMQLEPLAKKGFIAVKMMLLERTIALPFTGDKAVRGELEAVSIDLGGKKEAAYSCLYKVKRTKTGTERGKKQPYLFTVTLTFKNRQATEEFTYPLYAEEVAL